MPVDRRRTSTYFRLYGIVRLCVVTANRRLLWWFREARAVAAQLGLVVLGRVTRDDEAKRSAAEEAGATLRYWWHLVVGQCDQL